MGVSMNSLIIALVYVCVCVNFVEDGTVLQWSKNLCHWLRAFVGGLMFAELCFDASYSAEFFSIYCFKVI